MSDFDKTEIFSTAGGSDTHIVLEFPGMGFLYLGSIISLSYSVYREKTPVFNLGNNTLNGHGVGKKYVAGSIISSMFMEDEISKFVDKLSIDDKLYNKDITDFVKKQMSDSSLKEYHAFMKDDITPFNIHIIFTSEYHNKSRRIIVYGANFINNGQVMSINDIITENTASFIAKDIRELGSVGDEITNIRSKIQTLTVSQLLKK